MAKKKVLKITSEGKCPHCGGNDFTAPYTERAWQRFSGNPDGKGVLAHEDGYNVEEHSVELELAECRDCDKPVNLGGLEIS